MDQNGDWRSHPTHGKNVHEWHAMDGGAIAHERHPKDLDFLQKFGLVALIPILVVQVKELAPNLLSMRDHKVFANKAAHFDETMKSWRLNN